MVRNEVAQWAVLIKAVRLNEEVQLNELVERNEVVQ